MNTKKEDIVLYTKHGTFITVENGYIYRNGIDTNIKMHIKNRRTQFHWYKKLLFSTPKKGESSLISFCKKYWYDEIVEE